MEKLKEASFLNIELQSGPKSSRSFMNGARKIIDDYKKQCKGPILIPDIQALLKKKHKIRVGASLLRDYLREELGMRYRVLGVVGQRFDEQSTLLKR